MSIKLIALSLAAIVILSGCGAGTVNKNEIGEKKLVIVTSFYPMYISAINVAKGIPDVSVVNLTKPQTGCLHDYAVTPDDMKLLLEAQVFIVNGAGMESFTDKVVSQMPNLKIVEASKGIELLKGSGEEESNPHVWVSISNAIKQVENISEQLSQLDPNNASAYKANAEMYIKKLDNLRNKMHNELDGMENKDIITFHEAFPYFAKEFNLNIAAVIEREPGSEPGAKELADTIDLVKSLKTKALFAEPQYSSAAAETIARESGGRVYILDPVVTGEADGDTDAYLKKMEDNLKILKEALK